MCRVASGIFSAVSRRRLSEKKGSSLPPMMRDGVENSPNLPIVSWLRSACSVVRKSCGSDGTLKTNLPNTFTNALACPGGVSGRHATPAVDHVHRVVSGEATEAEAVGPRREPVRGLGVQGNP